MSSEMLLFKNSTLLLSKSGSSKLQAKLSSKLNAPLNALKSASITVTVSLFKMSSNNASFPSANAKSNTSQLMLLFHSKTSTSTLCHSMTTLSRNKTADSLRNLLDNLNMLPKLLKTNLKVSTILTNSP